MNAPSGHSPGTYRSWASAVIDRLCDQYEEDWRAGRVRDVGDYLAEADPAIRPSLSAELTAIASELEAEHDDPAAKDRGALMRAVTECPTFDHLALEPRTALANALSRRSFAPGDRVLTQGSACPGLHIVLDGRLTIEVHAAEAASRRIDDAIAGSVVGEMGLLTGNPCTANVFAAEATKTLFLDAAIYEDLRIRFPELEWSLGQLVGDRLGEREFDGLCGKRVGPCVLLRCLGRGAMGVVYEAQSEETGDPLAVKMLRHSLADDPHALTRFRREAELLQSLQHSGILAVGEVFLEYRTLFLSMELCRGRDLGKITAARGPLSPPVVRPLLGQVAAALNHAHERNIVHLDLKPANLLLDCTGRVKLADFGLARLLSDHDSFGLTGTPRYMPPEQLASEAVGAAADWYAWGCVAAELLSGRPLFDDSDMVAMAKAKASRQPVLSDDWTAQDPELAEVVRAAVHPLPELRLLDLDIVTSWARPVPELAAP
jgi:CRP-like cAMP-binding protein